MRLGVQNREELNYEESEELGEEEEELR